MRRFIRGQEPDVLKINLEKWGLRYEENREVSNGFQFSWPHIDYIPLNQLILGALQAQTDNHCSCDKFPLQRGDFTIDHFKPKSDLRFYRLVCKWDNLYLSCKHCQEAKGIQYSDDLLRPDAADYSFNKHFVYNYTLHEYEANPQSSDFDKGRALKTIKTFDLNHPGLKTARRHVFERYQADVNPLLTDYNYRFIFE